MINTVCFDLDGTLVNSKEVILRSFDHVFETMFLEHREKNLSDYRKYMGPLLEETFALYTNDKDKVKLAIETYIKYYAQIEFEYLKPYNNINSTLKWLKDNNINICLITNKRLSSSIPSMKHFDIYKYFDALITCDDQKDKPKPNRYPIDLACEKFKTTPNHVIMVGDNEVDIMCGNNAEAYSALVSYNDWYKDILELVEPDYILDDMSELITIIKKENNI